MKYKQNYFYLQILSLLFLIKFVDRELVDLYIVELYFFHYVSFKFHAFLRSEGVCFADYWYDVYLLVKLLHELDVQRLQSEV